jgi:ABC-type cobalamin/Fe3+-siderophores transport system ATPase subunit
VGVFGVRGGGKSTLLEVAAGILPPDEGRVFFEGRDLASLSTSERVEVLGDGIAWMNRAGLEHFSVLKYVAMAKKVGHGHGMRQAEDLAMEALERVGIPECAEQTWDRLSNWERVLVAFARGFVAKPHLMVVDDLLDWLSESGMREAGELLRSLAAELRCGVLIASADQEALMIADRVLTLDAGTITPKQTKIIDLSASA